MDNQSITINLSDDEQEEQITRERTSVSWLHNIRRSLELRSGLHARITRRLKEMQGRNFAGNWSPSVSIFKLPSNLTKINPQSTQPEMVSIGPYHRGKDQLLEFEDHKWYFLDKYLRRSRKDLLDLIREMDLLEARTRSCYSESIPMSSEDLIETMLLDGCFLIELFCHLGREEDHEDINDPIFTRPWLIPIIFRDLVKLENQLPLFVLQSLFWKSNSAESFINLVLEFFGLSWSGPTLNYRSEILQCPHLLDLLYMGLHPSFSVNSINERPKYRPSTHSMQCVTQLRRSGIKFKPREAQSFLDIKYEKKVLQIPSITINDITSAVLINCVALEQRQERNIKYFSNYVSFMYCLIGQPNDVALLGLDGIITNFSQDDQHVSDLFNDLGKNTVLNISESYLSKVFQDVEAYYSSYWANMMRTYFSSPWSFISVFSAFVLLMLTMVQTVMSLLSYKHGLN